MKSSSLLCDPALLGPPPDDLAEAVDFWTRVVEWSADRRLRLGPATYAVVLDLVGNGEWPTPGSIPYPPGLGQLASRALSTILQQVLSDGDASEPESVPAMTPSYRLDPVAANAIARDAVGLHREGVIGVATHSSYWDADAAVVTFDPPPPDHLPLISRPRQRLATERDLDVATYLAKRRITILGGEPSPHVLKKISNRFKISQREIRWVGCDSGERINLDCLDGIQAQVDVVYCVTGHISHAGSNKARKQCVKRGCQLREVEHGSDIPDDLARRHGGPQCPDSL